MTSILDYRCPACFALFGEIRLAVNEAAAIAEQARIVIHATKPSEHIDEWKQIRGRWEDAHQKWVLAAANLKNHFATTPRHARLSDTWPSFVGIRERLLRYRTKLFTFVDHDDVAWNNNQAENAIKQFAYYREGRTGIMRGAGPPGLPDAS